MDYIVSYVENETNSTFGVGCLPHDSISGYCELKKKQCKETRPTPRDCKDLSWCANPWCFVDGTNCNLTNRHTYAFENVQYSYATCGYIDSFTHLIRMDSLRGETMNVAYLDSDVGYKGGYNPSGSFAINDFWNGPVIDFVEHAAQGGGFLMNMMSPPDFLKERVKEFFNSTDPFDLCFFAASLGYIDICAGAFTLTDKRAGSGTWHHLNDESLYLISFLEKPKTKWDSFWDDALTILKPFTTGSWIIIFFVVLPSMGVLLMLHEDFDKDRVNIDNDILSHVKTALKLYYAMLLSFFSGSFEGQEISSVSGRVHLLGIYAFNLMVIAIFTANLAAILGALDLKIPIQDIQEVRNRGGKICASRDDVAGPLSIAEFSDLLLVDPIDGLPGFQNILSVVDFMREVVPDDENDIYCEAAILPEEIIDYLHGLGQHCNKTRVGDPLGHRSLGIPINPRYYDSLEAYFQQEFNDGVYFDAVKLNLPQDSCSGTDSTSDSGDAGMSIQHMSGVLVVTYTFAVVAFIFKQLEKKGSNQRSNEPDEL